MSTLPDYRFIRFRFYAPVAVEAARVDGASITGRWSGDEKRLYPEKGEMVARRFAICDDTPEQVRQFTARFGPLAEPPGRGKFSFEIDAWRASRKDFQEFWRALAKGGRPSRYWPLPGDAVEFRGKWLHLRCGTLWTFMMYELLSQPAKVRICERPDCKHPYFVAQHGKERYCSTECSNWSQAQLKKRWHEDQRRERIAKQQTR